MVIICKDVFDLAKKVTSVAFELPIYELNSLNPDMRISLAIMIADKKAIKKLLSKIVIAINEKQIRILSAMGSRTLPRSEVKFNFLARNPSKKSEIPLITIKSKDIRNNSEIIAINNKGPNTILDKVIHKIIFFIRNISYFTSLRVLTSP